jgi:hypothetical protein
MSIDERDVRDSDQHSVCDIQHQDYNNDRVDEEVYGGEDEKSVNEWNDRHEVGHIDVFQ